MTQTQPVAPAVIDRKRPGCLIFLLDQSSSMREPVPGEVAESKAQAVADAINELLHILVRRCTKDRGAPPRHYYDIAVIGYGGRGVTPLLGGRVAGRPLASIGEVAAMPLRHDVRDNVRVPIWIDPVATGGTPMCGALNAAGNIARGWVQEHRNSFPPIIFNITDGEPTDEQEPAELELWSERVRGLRSNKGNTLLFTLHLSSTVETPVSFPAAEGDVADDLFRRMFRISSELPEFMRARAGRVQPGARGLVCNGDMESIVWALEIGTSNRIEG